MGDKRDGNDAVTAPVSIEMSEQSAHLDGIDRKVNDNKSEEQYIVGWRMFIIGLMVDQSGWIVTAYLLGYVGFLMVWASLSEIFGRKFCVIAAIAMFTIFSGASGAAQTINQMIICRAFQGIGGSGVYTIPYTLLFELSPPAKYPLYGIIVSLTLMMSLLIGPFWGGAINDAGQWRWVFLLNVPAGVILIIAYFFILPNRFPVHVTSHRSSSDIFNAMRKIDYPGAAMLLCGNVFLIAVLQEAGTRYDWNSAFVVLFFIIAAASVCGFHAWEWFVSNRQARFEPVLPWRLMNRHFLGIMGSIFFVGCIYNATIFLIPQRYIVVNGLSPLQAGIRLIPFTVSSPIGSVIASILFKKKVPLIYVNIMGFIFQMIGFGLLTSLPVTKEVNPAQYGYEILAGWGAGFSIVALTILVPLTVKTHDKGIGNGLLNQYRNLGGAISLALSIVVLNNYLTTHLNGTLSSKQIGLLLQATNTVDTFPADVQETVRHVFGAGYDTQMKILVAFAAAQVPWTILMWRRNPTVVEE